jgi:hypothetical protein
MMNSTRLVIRGLCWLFDLHAKGLQSFANPMFSSTLAFPIVKEMLLKELEPKVKMYGTKTVPDNFFQSLMLPNLQFLELDFVRL